MALKPDVAALVEALNAFALDDFTKGHPSVVREAMKALRPQNPVLPPLSRHETRTIKGRDGHDIPIRIYAPEGAPEGAGENLPLIVFFHGGGWVFGDLDGHDLCLATLSNTAQAVIVSVDYRLAPEAKFPVPLHDCYDATLWAVQNAADLGADITRLAVGGDSAGGNLAAAVALMAREDAAGPDIAAQILYYPVTDANFERPSYLENAEGYFLTRKAMQYFWDNYLNSSDEAGNPLAAPLQADHHRDLPPAYVITAEYDPLRDEGHAYAGALIAAGGTVKYECFKGQVHGFVSMTGTMADSPRALTKTAAFLNAVFA